MENNFLTNLKKALDGEEVNMDSINKINEVLNKSYDVSSTNTQKEIVESFNSRVESGGKKVVDEKIALEGNKQYELEMEKIKNIDVLSNIVANTLQIESLVLETLNDLISHINQVRSFISENESKYLGLEEYTTVVDLLERIENNYNLNIDNND